MKEIKCKMDATGLTVAIVCGRFNDLIGERLVAGARETLVRHGVTDDHITLFTVPGAFEIPLALQALAESKKYEVLIALGAVIRGSTPHFDYVAGEASKGIAALSLKYNLPIGFGVLTCDTFEQALDRAGGKAGNKGADAAVSAIEMALLLKKV